MKMVFSGLSPLVIDDATDEGERILVRARTPERAFRMSVSRVC